jgi:hypothetical protein
VGTVIKAFGWVFFLTCVALSLYCDIILGSRPVAVAFVVPAAALGGPLALGGDIILDLVYFLRREE